MVSEYMIYLTTDYYNISTTKLASSKSKKKTIKNGLL